MNRLSDALAAFSSIETGKEAILIGGSMTDDLIEPLYEILSSRGAGRQLNLIVCSAGGSITASRRIALYLRERADRLRVFVPRLARSAATLLTLSGDEIVMGPLSELSPVDVLVGDQIAEGRQQSFISSEDVRSYSSVASDWFGVNEADNLQVFALLAQRISPGSLSNFYRADRYVRSVATEMLSSPGSLLSAEKRAEIVDALLSGRIHEEAIFRGEAQELGLSVTFADHETETAMWRVWREWQVSHDSGTLACVAAAGGRMWLVRESRSESGAFSVEAGWTFEGDE